MAIKKGVKSKVRDEEGTSITGDFEAIPNYDAREVPPEAPAGKWTAICTVTKKLTKQKDGGPKPRPMLELKWKLTGTASKDPKVKKFANGKTTLRDYLIFGAPGDPGDRMFKQKLHSLCKGLKFDIAEVAPIKGVKAWADLDALYEELHEYEGTIYTWLQKDKNNNDEERAQVAYEPPRGELPSAGDDEDEDEDEDEDKESEEEESEEEETEEEEEEEETEEEEEEEEEEEAPPAKSKAPPPAKKLAPPAKKVAK